jgi:hypothetical protein
MKTANSEPITPSQFRIARAESRQFFGAVVASALKSLFNEFLSRE